MANVHFKRILTILLAFLLIQRAGCATRNAASPEYSDVNFAVNGGGPDSNGVTFNGAAADGDIVVIPVGMASWTSGLIITHGITLQGQTVVTGDHTTSPKMTATDYTIIQDNVPRTVDGGALISHKMLTPAQSVRITGLTLQYGVSVTSSDSTGVMRLNGTCPSFRVDHCHFNQLYGYAFLANGWLYGVVDHCIFDIRNGGGAIIVHHSTWGNQVNGWGSWAEPAYFGSEKFVFVEDNTVNNLGIQVQIGICNAKMGGRYVLRYNVINNGSTLGHGTESGNYRGVRAYEIYNNAYFTTRPMGGGQCRGGTLLLHDNTYTGQYTGSIQPVPFRLFQNAGGAGTGSVWAGADGTNPWDFNATEPDGTHVDGHPPYTFATGMHVGPNISSQSTEIVGVSGPPWTPNQWAGYTITNTNSASPYYLGHGYISSNTINTLTVTAIAINPPNYVLGFNTGDTFAIHKVLRILDQPGSGPGDLIIGNPPGSTNLTGTSWPHYPNQALEPLYSWNNTLNGVNVNFGHSDADNNLRENIDFFNNTPMPGYTPYVYPHPLVTGIPPPTPTPTPTVTPTPTPTPTETPTPTPTPALSGLTYNGGITFVNGTNLIQGTSYTITAQAKTSTKSVVFKKDGAIVKTDSAIPFDFTWTPTQIGKHFFIATPWNSTGGIGSSGISITVSFNVVAGSPTPTPTVTPTPTPSVTPTPTPTPVPNFSLSISPSSRSVSHHGGTASYIVTITRSGGFDSPVNLSISGVPSGASGGFSPNPATTSSALTVRVASSVAQGTYTFTVTGTGGSPTITHTAQATLIKNR